jgi:hypothetical protein
MALEELAIARVFSQMRSMRSASGLDALQDQEGVERR